MGFAGVLRYIYCGADGKIRRGGTARGAGEDDWQG